MAQRQFQPYPFHPGPIRTTNNEQRTTPLPDHEDDDEQEDETRAKEN